jgi:hypothetical protein
MQHTCTCHTEQHVPTPHTDEASPGLWHCFCCCRVNMKHALQLPLDKPACILLPGLLLLLLPAELAAAVIRFAGQLRALQLFHVVAGSYWGHFCLLLCYMSVVAIWQVLGQCTGHGETVV